MTHWLDDEINRQRQNIGNDIIVSTEGLRNNISENKDTITAFMERLIFLFSKLKTVINEEFELSFEKSSPNKVFEYERIRFDAINTTQPTVFLRRADIILCDNPGDVRFELYRAKRQNPTDPWKYHDEQIITCQMDRFSEEVTYELIDWFAWKTYFPRGIRNKPGDTPTIPPLKS